MRKKSPCRSHSVGNEPRAPGCYEAPIDAAALPSGLYVYRIEVGRFTATRQMLLVK